MEHVVFFPAPDGSPAFHRAAGLEDAVRLVEHLRNVEGVTDVTVHPLGAEVPLAFRAWYRVEVPSGGAAAPAVPQQAAPAPVLPPEAPAVQPPVAEAPVAEAPVAEAPVAGRPGDELAAEPAPGLPGEGDASANGHHDTVKSLGFFAT